MAWKITKDLIADTDAKPGTNANAVSVTSRTVVPDAELTHRFRMLDADGQVYYEGRSSEADSFAPLDDFGEPNAGAITIQYWKSGPGGGWKAL